MLMKRNRSTRVNPDRSNQTLTAHEVKSIVGGTTVLQPRRPIKRLPPPNPDPNTDKGDIWRPILVD
jgi:hypothetical protein